MKPISQLEMADHKAKHIISTLGKQHIGMTHAKYTHVQC